MYNRVTLKIETLKAEGPGVKPVPSALSLMRLRPQQPAQRRYQRAQGNPCKRRQKHSNGRPLQAVRLLVNRQGGGGAGPVEQGKQRHTCGGCQRPAVGDQQRTQTVQPLHFHQRPLRQVGHQHDGQHDLIGGKA